MISQLFFPIKGILVVYDRETQDVSRRCPAPTTRSTCRPTRCGAPTARSIVFARAKAYHAERLEQQNSALVDEKDVPEFTVEKQPFRYDLYRIPFNDGKGGTPEPLRGASGDGMSNFFPKYSPDGKWIVFCKAKSYMLLQPDSELYIIPAEGGVARRLRYNTARMNSWHSWSSNSRWLVFSSKVNGPYTQLFLTHIDEDGNDSPPVAARALHLAGPGREHSGVREAARRRHRRDSRAVPRSVLVPAGRDGQRAHGRPHRARSAPIGAGWRSLRTTPSCATRWDGRCSRTDGPRRRWRSTSERWRRIPSNAKAHNNLALALVELGQLDEAAESLRRRRSSSSPRRRSTATSDSPWRGWADRQEALANYQKALELDPNCASAHFNLAVTLVQAGKFAEAESHYRQALPGRPTAETHNGLGYVLARQGRTDEAIAEFRKAIDARPEVHARLQQPRRGAGEAGEARGGGVLLSALARREAEPGRPERARRRPAPARQDATRRSSAPTVRASAGQRLQESVPIEGD